MQQKSLIALYQTYSTIMERVSGVEPPSKHWECSVLPLNYTRMYSKYTKFTSNLQVN